MCTPLQMMLKITIVLGFPKNLTAERNILKIYKL